MNTSLKRIFRSIRNNKVLSFISISGLGIGLGCVMLLTVLFLHDTSFDQYIPDHQNVYRVAKGDLGLTPYPLGETIQRENPMVEGFFRYFLQNEVEIKDSKNQLVQGKSFAFADTSIFQMLGVKIKVGNAALSKDEVAISAKTKTLYFPNESALGKQIKVRINEEFIALRVSGVYDDFPATSSIDPKFIANIKLTAEALSANQKMFGGVVETNFEKYANWDSFRFYTYLRLLPDTKPNEVSQFMQKYKQFTTNIDKKDLDYSLQSVADIYLGFEKTDLTYDARKGNSKALNYYLAIALLILLIALINYVSLNKAKFESRSKEIGSQKAIGASNSHITKQVILESMVIAFLSLIPAIAILLLGIPYINEIMHQNIDFEIFSQAKTWFILLTIILFSALISGMLISQNIVRFPSVVLLKGLNNTISKKSIWRNAVLCIDFILFIALTSCVFILHKQLQFSVNNRSNIQPDNVLVYSLNTTELSEKYQVIKNEVDQLSGVIASAGSSFVPPTPWRLPLRMINDNNEKIKFDGLIMGQGMINLLQIPLKEGEAFDDYEKYKYNAIFNETAAKEYDLKVGEEFSGFRVKGIVKDFQAHSMHYQITPMVIIQQHPQKMRYFVVKTDGIDNSAITASIDNIITNIAPDNVIDSYLLTDRISKLYAKEQSQTKLINAFTLLAILLSVMGLLGMTYNLMHKKNKEIGIRKVNGATISEILILLNKDFIKWVIMAFVIACPIAYYAMSKWLENFAYKTELSWWIFALAGVLALGIALITVSWQSWRAATRNPVEALRYE